MAKQRNTPNTTEIQSNTFVKGMNKDFDPSFIQDGMWTHARNAVNNTSSGELGTLSNEESNALCAKVMQSVPQFNKDIIGVIHLFSDKWVIFSVSYNTQDTKAQRSEIGLFEEDVCRYRTIVNDTCLNFNKLYLITGASRLLDDCSWEVYWADNLNPDRHINIGDPKLWIDEPFTYLGGDQGSNTINFYSNGTTRVLWPGVPWVQDCDTEPVQVDEDGDGNPDATRLECRICKDINELDCDKLRIAKLLKTPCADVKKGQQPGSLPNGSYAVAIAYTIDRVRVTNYFSVGYPQPIYLDPDLRGSLEIEIDADQEAFDEFEVVLIRFTNQNQDARRIGYYSTRTTRILIDLFQDQSPNISVGDILLKDYIFEKSEQIIAANNYLLRLGPTSKFDFNYQPLANLIQAEWVSVEYDEKYYTDGGKNAGYLRDEIYAFFIRWVYDTGDKSSSYHIPGRPSGNYVTPAPYNVATTDRATIDGINSLGASPLYDDSQVYDIWNTAEQTSIATSTLEDGGKVIASGKMGYWESSEVYPDNRPDIWNSSYYCWTGSTSTDYDLCGKNIRHHKFPDNGLTPNTFHFTKDNNGDYKIRLMGVRFKNIILPKDNDGNDIPNIVGYEILRGSRNGNKTILAKGMINNFRNYSIPGTPKAIAGGSPGTIGLYANYPYNCILPRSNKTNAVASALNAANYKYNDPFIIRRAVDSDPQNPYKRIKQNIPIDIQSFHSPDTSYNNPTLSASEMKVYGWLYGQATQRFIEPEKHPEFKLMDNNAILIAAIGGIINVILNTIGEININYPEVNYTVPRYPYVVSNTTTGTGFSDPGGTAFTPGVPPNSGGLSGYTLAQPTLTGYLTARNAYLNGGAFFTDVLGGQDIFSQTHQNTASLLSGYTNQFTLPQYSKTYTGYSLLPSFLQNPPFIGGLLQLSQSFYFFQEGAKDTIDVLYAIIRTRQYALQLIGHGEYSEFRTYASAPNEYLQSTKDRFRLAVGSYVRDQLFQFPTYQAQNYDYSFPDQPYSGEVNYRINNLLRPDLVVIRTTDDSENPSGPHFIIDENPNIFGAPKPESVDQSSMTLGLVNRTPGYGWDLFNSATENIFKPRNKSNQFETAIASYYVGLKYTFRNLYRQLDSIVQVMVTPCEQRIDFTPNSTQPNTIQTTAFPNLCNLNFTQTKIKTTPVFFGGDTYVTRHTEKTIMPFFYEWLYGQPDNARFNYFTRQNVPEPRFMVNSNKWDFSDFTFLGFFQSILGGNPDTGEGALPRDYYDLDNVNYNEETNITTIYPGVLGVKNSYFYTSACGIKDFFVESEVLTDFRFQGRSPEEKSYNKWSFTDFQILFSQNPAILTKGNYFRYDYSLSAARFLFSQYYNNGALQGRNYDPTVAELCYTSFPNRIQYSNVLTEHTAYDAWLMFLALNKVDFKSELNSVKTFAKTGLLVTFNNSSPLVFQGVDQRETYIGVKATVGDGGLFATTPQNIVVADQPYQYGSCQSKYSVISTPAGIYFISQQQGKIFAYTSDGLQEISQNNMKWWFDKFLPFKILEEFPDYPHTDNPVAGVGCTASYDNSNSIIYFSKRDFQVKEEYKGRLLLNADNNTFTLIDNNSRSVILLGDKRYFHDASWTISYDPKNQYWVSFHDWVPGFYLPGKGHFLTTRKDGIWQHNDACNDYCNFYGTQYPFEVELPVSTGQTVTTIRSIEYYLECYRKDSVLCTDQFHILDYNFSQAIISNSEQTSGILNLNLYPKNNVTLAQTYPKLNNNLASYDILFSKEENKYRFNQFWDITLDRGEFPQGAGYPPTGPLVPNTTQLLGNYTENNIWITQPNGYVKNLNPVNLNYNKPLTQRKKFRHYSNFVKLIKDNSRDTNMILKIVNTKSQLSTR